MKIISKLFLFVLPLFLFAPDAYALAGDWQSDEALSVRLISGIEGTGERTIVPLGLEMKLSPDWHTYWRSPGEAGLPPQFNWQKSQTDAGNLKSVTLYYPAPKRYTAFGLETIGYRDAVVLPIDAEVMVPGKPLVIDTAVDILVCSKLCVPKHFQLKLTIPAGAANEGSETSVLKQYRDKVPSATSRADLAIKNVVIGSDAIAIDITSATPLEGPDLFVENEKYLDFSAPTVDIAADKLSAHVIVKPLLPLAEGTKLSDLAITFTVTDGERSLEQKTSPPAPAAEASRETVSALNSHVKDTSGEAGLPLSLVLAIAFAFIGGFILNLMPCVLPVLSLKILSVVSHGGGEARLVRHSFFMTAAGILFSFLVLASVTIGLKEAGLSVGWGVQYQQPVFLGVLILLLTFFAANMWGLYEIKLPRFLADSLSGPYHPKLAGDFATGAFATLLATPCSAPFLGTAVGFALASGAREILLIFAALGLGMSMPYLTVALLPRLATALPKPGIWMMHLRHFMAWALSITALWFIYVLGAQISIRGAFVVFLCMLGVVGLFALNSLRPRSYLIFGIASFAILAFGTALAGTFAPKPITMIDPAWVAFDESAIASDVSKGKTVFVDVTAGWCLTCKVNKKLVLSNTDITKRLFSENVVAMMADWTSPDPVISAFLQKYKRFGIPFNIVFGPDAPEGIVLPELLTQRAVMDAIEKAAKSP